MMFYPVMMGDNFTTIFTCDLSLPTYLKNSISHQCIYLQKEKDIPDFFENWLFPD